jgi:hypothetical protein
MYFFLVFIFMTRVFEGKKRKVLLLCIFINYAETFTTAKPQPMQKGNLKAVE